MPKALIEMGTYTYVVQGHSDEVPSGTTFRVRRMSTKERLDWMQEDLEIVNAQIQHYGESCVEGCPTTDGRDALYKEVRKIARRLLSNEDLIRLSAFKKASHANDLWGFPSRVIQVEIALLQDKDAAIPEQIVVPDPTVVDEADAKRLESIEKGAIRLGEPLAETKSPTTTPSTCSPVETSSDGSAETSADIESPES